MGTLPLFGLNLQTFVGMLPNIVSFAILAFVFQRFLYKPIRKILQTRAERIAAEIEAAAADKEEAARLKATYEQKITEVDAERNAILEEARKEAVFRRDQMLEDAKADAAIIRERAQRDIAAELERVKTDVHHAIIDISTDMASKLVTATIDKSNHDRLFDEAMAELESTAFRAR